MGDRRKLELDLATDDDSAGAGVDDDLGPFVGRIDFRFSKVARSGRCAGSRGAKTCTDVASSGRAVSAPTSPLITSAMRLAVK